MYRKIYKSMRLLSFITLILSAFMIIVAFYTSFNERIKNDLKNEAIVISGLLNNSPEALDIYSEGLDFNEKNIRIYSAGGEILFSLKAAGKNSEKTERTAVLSAGKNGFGEGEHYSFSGFADFFCYAVRLENGRILCLSGTTAISPYILLSIFVSLILIAAFIYILSSVAAKILTKNIVRPIENVYSFDNISYDGIYEEIRPFLNRIISQNMEINRQIDKVKAQKIRLQTITENISEGLIIFDRRENILTANSCVCELFSTTESLVKHRTLYALTDNKELHFALAKAVEGKKSYIITEINDKNYQIFYSPVYEDKKLNAIVMLLFDVSEKYAAENMRREFSANVSHELKTPLTTIHGYAQIINQGIAKPEDIKGFSEKIEKESSRLMALIEDIIKLSILDEGEEKHEKQDISLLSVSLDVKDRLSSRAAERNIEIKILGGDTTVYANLSQITELIYNLTDNAIKYNKDNGEVIIKISKDQISVEDTGIGISEEYHERIFERFFRVDKSRSKKVNGTGLGLSIVKHIAKVNNARIFVESTPGVGTTFTAKFSKNE